LFGLFGVRCLLSPNALSERDQSNNCRDNQRGSDL